MSEAPTLSDKLQNKDETTEIINKAIHAEIVTY
jgi:hypothetical protein